MDLFLKIVGLVSLLLFGGLLVAGVIIWRFWRKFVRAAGSGLPPSTIQLIVDPAPTWLGHADVRREAAGLEAAGFVRGEAFSIQEMPEVKLLSFCHPQTYAFGCVYQHTQAGVWTDVCANGTDGREFTVTNAPMGSEIDAPPYAVKVFRKGAKSGELIPVLYDQLQGQTAVRIGPDDFAREFTAAYARGTAWRNTRGISEEEVRRIADNHFSGKLTEEQLKDAFVQTKADEIERWAQDAIESFSQVTSLPVAEWRRYENDLFLFGDKLHPAGFLRYLAGEMGLCPDRLHRCEELAAGGSPLRDVLAVVATDTGAEFVKLGEVTAPIAAEIHAIKKYPTEPDTEPCTPKKASAN